MNEHEIIKLIEDEYKNPYPPDIFDWDNKDKMDITRGRFNEFVWHVAQYSKQDIINLIQENLKPSDNNDLKKVCYDINCGANKDDVCMVGSEFQMFICKHKKSKPIPKS